MFQSEPPLLVRELDVFNFKDFTLFPLRLISTTSYYEVEVLLLLFSFLFKHSECPIVVYNRLLGHVQVLIVVLEHSFTLFVMLDTIFRQ